MEPKPTVDELAAKYPAVQSLSADVAIPTPYHPFQGHLLPDAELGEFVTEIVDTQGDMVDVEVVSIQLSGSNRFLYHMEGSGDTFPFSHFGFKEMTAEEAKDDPSSQFQLETNDTTTQLRSLVYGELVSMVKHDAIPKGAVATAVDEPSDATTLQAIHKDNTLRLVGPRRQHLRLVTLTNLSGQPYDVLASKSSVPVPQGLFIVHH
jgi:hypothetical protein